MALLTDTKARSIKPDDKPMPHGGVPGLRLMPTSTRGRGKWELRYTSPTTGKRRDAGLGTYPETGIAAARDKAQAMREQVAAGADPIDTARADRLAPKMPTFAEAAQEVHAEQSPGWKNPKHRQQWINTLAEYAFPTMGSLPLDVITPRHAADALRPIWLEKPETAGRVKQRIHAVMSWGWAHGFITANPVDVVTHLLPQQLAKPVRTEHHPAMPWAAVPAFVIETLRPSAGYTVTAALLEFVILTACRSGEARAATWCEIDLERAIWTIPANRMKTKTAHAVPLSDQAVALLKRMQAMGLHPDLVFPALRGSVLSDMTLTALLRRVKAVSATPGRTATVHGFRSTFRDWCSEHGYPRDLAERALAHTIANKVEAAYHRTDLLEQRRPMMQAWANFVTSSENSDVVVPFTRRTA